MTGPLTPRTPRTAMAQWLFDHEVEVMPGLRACVASKIELLAIEDQSLPSVADLAAALHGDIARCIDRDHRDYDPGLCGLMAIDILAALRGERP